MSPYPPTPDAVLLARASTGDDLARAELMDRHRMSAFALAYNILVDAEDAERVVEQALDAALGAAVAQGASVWRCIADQTRERARRFLDARGPTPLWSEDFSVA